MAPPMWTVLCYYETEQNSQEMRIAQNNSYYSGFHLEIKVSIKVACFELLYINHLEIFAVIDMTIKPIWPAGISTLITFLCS